MRDDPTVVALVRRAGDGDRSAWDEIVDRYAPLVWSICRRFGLDRVTAADVGQSVWLRLVEQLPALRDPAALPGWLATTTRRECLRILRAARRQQRLERPIDDAGEPDADAATVEQELLAAELHVALRQSFARLPLPCQRLLALLIEDPPVSYAEISARLAIPIGSIGPNRARCLAKLRRHPALAALLEAELHRAREDRHDTPCVNLGRLDLAD